MYAGHLSVRGSRNGFNSALNWFSLNTSSVPKNPDASTSDEDDGEFMWFFFGSGWKY